MQELIVTSGSRRVGVQVFGDEHADQTLIYFHGFPGSRLEPVFFDSVAAELSFKVIAFDRPGFGLTDAETLRTIPSIATIVKSILDALNVPKATALGLSGGAPYALAACRYLPERIAAAIIVSGIGPFFSDGPAMSVDPRLFNGLNQVNKALLRIGTAFPRKTSAAVQSIAYLWRRFPVLIPVWFKLLLDDNDRSALAKSGLGDKFIANFVEALRQGTRAPRDEFQLLCRPWGFDLQSIRQPVSIWHGDGDRYVSLQHAVKLHETLSTSTLTVVPGGGHFMILERVREILVAVGVNQTSGGKGE